MYLRKPLVHRSVLCCRHHRGRRRPPASATLALLSSNSPGEGNDFVRYTEAEFTDALFTTPPPAEAGAGPVGQQLTSSLSLTPSPAAGLQLHYLRRRPLHSGREVSSLPPTHAIFNHLNSPLWLQVLARLHGRGALSGEDRAGAIRYLPAFTYRSLMPWLWSPTASLTQSEAAQLSGTGRPSEVDRSNSTANKLNVEADVYTNMSLVALEMSRRPTVLRAPPAEVPKPAYTVTDIGTAAPAQWTAIAASVVHSIMASTLPVTLTDLLRVWHDLFFALRSHAVWVGTPEQLRDCAHPQLMRLLERFYADVRRHGRLPSTSGGCENDMVFSEEGQLQQGRDDGAIQVVVHTLTPPILLRKFRGLYRPHRNSAMLFAELYALCINEEETSLRLFSSLAAKANDVGASEAKQPVTHMQQQQQQQRRITTTALLMDVDLAAYYATLPGRRHSGLRDAGEQWAVTLQHLRFLLPRVHLLQRCLEAQCGSSIPRKNIAAGSVWEPWRQIASIVMNVCMWVSNDNAEAQRLTDALRCMVETLANMNDATSVPGRKGEHQLLAPLTSQNVGVFISCLVEAARDSMRNKAAQLQYGPTDGLLGVYLLSVAVTAVIPATMRSHKPTTSRREGDDEVTLRCAGAGDDTGALLQRLRLLSHPPKKAPREVWAALRRSAAAGEAARYGLVTVGHRLFSECVIPLASQSKTLGTAQRLWGRLHAWATEVGRPLGLHGESVSTLWQLRWLQEQRHALSASRPPCSADSKNSEARALLDRLSPPRAGADSHCTEAHHTEALTKTMSWCCGCGFENKRHCPTTSVVARSMDTLGVACAACVLRTLTPLSWECPSCHTVASSGVCVPYCLCCGEAHPLAGQLATAVQRPSMADARSCSGAVVGDGGVPVAPSSARNMPSALDGGVDAGLNGPHEGYASPRVVEPEATVYVCSDCHAISAGPHLPDDASAATRCVEATGCRTTSCTSCGSPDPGYYTAFFTWTCGCGACNSPLHAYCHACSQAAQRPTVTCTHCNHAQPVTGTAAMTGSGDVCKRCHHPLPRVLAAVQQHRLVHCPACQGRVSSTAVQCPHCACTAVEAVAALLPTEADCPWLCHRCGTTHPVRDAVNGQLNTPAHLVDVSSSRVQVPLYKPCEDDRCTTCGTRRIPATIWERGRLWACSECGEPHNSELACRRCASLAPGVPAAEVCVWRCGTCKMHHPGWETRCRTVGCGGRRATDGVEARLCYSPWTCAECGEVTLSSHLAACTTCGTETPASLRATTCIYGDACAKTALATTVVRAVQCGEEVKASSTAHVTAEKGIAEALLLADGEVRTASGGTCAGLSSSLAYLPSVASPAPAPPAMVQTSRLEEVEAFLLQAASQPALPFPSDPLDIEAGSASSSMPLWPPRSSDTCAHADKPTNYSTKSRYAPSDKGGVVAGRETATSILDVQPWEEAYAAAVMSF
ncbi:hypothetical protein JKF63_07350 [Porcisia hertigi]|uniref:RanBP2-type domain-containing protein n=1 Tax=Porcisia hertigi TaxID=2761500 RepID=A0A836LKS6_9TRYP|nr:hypothetical protein JKF63_07350 [Porcisia hertigi]